MQYDAALNMRVALTLNVRAVRLDDTKVPVRVTCVIADSN